MAEQVVCASCGAAFESPFCPACGERRLDHHDLSLRHFVAHSLHDVTHFDTKIFRSLKVLVSEPGRLTADYVDGRRVGWLSPVQLFVMVNVIFFFVAPKLGLFRFGYDYFAGNEHVLLRVATKPALDAARGGRDVPEFRTEFDHAIDHPKRLLIFIMVALFAVLLAALLYRRKRYFVEHVVFALHYYAFWMIASIAVPAVLVVIGTIMHVAGGGGLRFGDPLLIPLTIASSMTYLYFAIRRFYGASKTMSAVHATTLSFAMIAIFLVYRGLLFLLALRLV